MKKIFSTSFIFVLILFSGFTLAQNLQEEENKTGSIIVMVDGCSNENGNANISLCNSKETYEDEFEKGFQSVNVKIKDGKAEYIFRDIPFGSYAVKVIHDENENRKLDRKLFGIPSEEYGFSNNAWATFGLPKFEEAAFILNKPEMSINIKVRHW
jgi:uncharacterized protein (DUF2141 family)